MDLSLDFNAKVEKIYDNCIDNLLLLTTRTPFGVSDVTGLEILANTYLTILHDLNALSDGEDDGDPFIEARSNDFICDECADGGEALFAASGDLDDPKVFINRMLKDAVRNAPYPPPPPPPAPLSDRDLNYVLNDMPPIILCGFGFSEN